MTTPAMNTQIADCIMLLAAGHTRQEILNMEIYAPAAVDAAIIATAEEAKG
jgi:hypothetical protein